METSGHEKSRWHSKGWWGAVGTIATIVSVAVAVLAWWKPQSPDATSTPVPPTSASKRSTTSHLPGPNFEVDFEASEFHGWQHEISTSPSVSLQFVANYDNVGSVQQDNVVFKFELPPELVYQPGTTRLGNYFHPDGIQTNDITNALNVGSYGPGANAWILFSASLKDERAFLCDTRTLAPVVRIETDNGTKSAEVVLKVKRRC